MYTARLPCLFLLPLGTSLSISDGHSSLWRLFFGVFGRKSRARRGRGGSSPRVLWSERWFASEGVSVLGRRCCVAAAQGDQQRWSIVPGDPFTGLQGRLRASCVWVKVHLKQIWLWGQKKEDFITRLFSKKVIKAKLLWVEHSLDLEAEAESQQLQ